MRFLGSSTPTTRYQSLPRASPLSPAFQPPLFLEEEKDVEVSAAILMVRQARQVWKRSRANLLKNVSEMKRYVDRR